MKAENGRAVPPLATANTVRRGAESAPSAPARRDGGLHLSSGQRKQIAAITVGAVAVFCFLRWLPTGTALSHMDFRVDAKNPIDFCDPLNPQFIPVMAVASPVTMAFATSASAGPAADRSSVRAGETVNATVTLKTASGKPIAEEDLLVVHTKRLHLLIADPTLTDYQHVHPEPTGTAGEWRFAFTPRFGGAYRIFADFTPAATARGLYAQADLGVEPAPAAGPGSTGVALAAEWSTGRSGAGGAGGGRDSRPADEQPPYRFELTPGSQPIRARQPADLQFTITRGDGGRVPLEPVMGAFAHLVAFDEARSGFAHLHPMEADPTQPPDAVRPTLNFKITIPAAGRYVIWAQVDLGGRETFWPFWFDVAP